MLEANATSDSFPEDNPIHIAETQYREATEQKHDLPKEATASDVEKVQRQINKIHARAVYMASQVLQALYRLTDELK